MKQPTVMLVDDDQDDIDLFIEAVNELGMEFKIITANHGLEALKLLQERSDLHHIFLDINMPVMNGLEFLEHYMATKDHAGIPITVYTTSSKTSFGIGRCLDLGAQYLQKPTSYNALLNELKRILSVKVGT